MFRSSCDGSMMVRNPRKLVITLYLMFSQLYNDPGGRLKYQFSVDSSRAHTKAFAKVASSPPANTIATSICCLSCLRCSAFWASNSISCNAVIEVGVQLPGSTSASGCNGCASRVFSFITCEYSCPRSKESLVTLINFTADLILGFYRGISPGVTGSLATGATYFGVIESTKTWLEKANPNLSRHWSHFIAGAIGDTLGSFVYVPCEVMKQRMQVQGTRKSWQSAAAKGSISQQSGAQMYGYYNGVFHAGCSIWRDHGLKGLYAGYWSTLARDVPFAGLMVTFYEAMKDLTEYGKGKYYPDSDLEVSNSFEGLVLGGLAGGCSAYLTTPLDVIKTRLQVQGSTTRYNGWLDAITKTWTSEGLHGLFKGSVPRIIWYIPASAITFMAVEFLRDHFNDKGKDSTDTHHELATLSIDTRPDVEEAV
ncbi:hypothetical protein PR202_gb19031 [Eleusine coracana subsp. coracana]|uniref:Mitochondrial carrier protein n=1 Tax=Eleusine coracana subsp. coracana TaxID=191504 RepID=A0AAV5F782_ELECO|nr:hypothetical protein PR202_gb19031 [Eleusine coracana subsp. coracana]